MQLMFKQDMYHLHHNQTSFSQRTSIPTERELLLQAKSDSGETGLVLSTDAKPRLKWTHELHERFVVAVNQLGGADKATPKSVMRIMGIPGLTLYHLKSHLQKFRLSKNLHAGANNGNSKHGVVATTEAVDKIPNISEELLNSTNHRPHTNNNLQINEALQMQIEVQRRLHEQIEVQRHLQLRIEAQGKYLQSVLEKAHESLQRQNLGSTGLELSKTQLSEMVTSDSPKYLGSEFSGLKEASMTDFYGHPIQTNQLGDCSIESCLTTSEGTQKDHEIHNANIRLANYHANMSLSKKGGEDSKIEKTETEWNQNHNERKMFTSSQFEGSEQKIGDLSMGIGNNIYQGRDEIRNSDDTLLDRSHLMSSSNQQGNGNQSKSARYLFLSSRLDLNIHDDNDASANSKRFDLNGFSWN